MAERVTDEDLQLLDELGVGGEAGAALGAGVCLRCLHTRRPEVARGDAADVVAVVEVRDVLAERVVAVHGVAPDRVVDLHALGGLLQHGAEAGADAVEAHRHRRVLGEDQLLRRA